MFADFDVEEIFAEAQELGREFFKGFRIICPRSRDSKRLIAKAWKKKTDVRLRCNRAEHPGYGYPVVNDTKVCQSCKKPASFPDAFRSKRKKCLSLSCLTCRERQAVRDARGKLRHGEQSAHVSGVLESGP